MKTLLLFSTLFTAACLQSQTTFQWAKNFIGPQSGDVQSIAADVNGNVYTVGSFDAITDFDPGVGTFTLASAGISDIYVIKLDPSGNFVWALRFGSTQSDHATGVFTDATGNVYVTGWFTGTVDFDPGPGTSNLTAIGQLDTYIMKLSGSGSLVWVKQIGGNANEIATNITLDANGNVITIGYYNSTADFDPGPGTYSMTQFANNDVFVSKLDASGNFIWARSLGGYSADNCSAVVTDAAGNVYTAGAFMGTADFDPDMVGSFNLTSAGAADIFLNKLDAAGNHVWTKQLGGSSTDISNSIALAGSDVLLMGQFQGSIDFDPGVGSFSLTSVGGIDICLWRLSSSGNFVWAKQMGSTDDDKGGEVLTDASGNIFSSGTFSLTLDSDPGPSAFNLTSFGGTDFFVSKLNAAGNFVWARQMGGAGSDANKCMAMDPSGNFLLGGTFQGTADFNPGAPVYTITSNGITDVYVQKLGQCTLAVPVVNGPTSVCSGTAVNVYSVAVNNGSNTVYTWNLPAGWSATSNTNVITVNAGSAATGVFTVYIADFCGVGPQQTLNVTVNALPTVSISSNPTLLCVGETATLSGAGASTYTWYPGAASGTDFQVSPTAATQYTAVGTDANGCSNAAVMTLSVDACVGIKELNTTAQQLLVYPNPFRDQITIEINNEKAFSVEVFNASGMLVYAGKTENGKMEIDLASQAPGIYFLKAGTVTRKIIRE